MSCNRCGTSTPRSQLCKQCAMIKNVEDSHHREEHMSSDGERVVTDGGVAVDAGDADEVEQHRHVGKTVSTNQRYWYEVHDAAEPGKVRLLAIDNVPNRVLTHEELDESMADGWNIVYDGQTGELGGDLHE